VLLEALLPLVEGLPGNAEMQTSIRDAAMGLEPELQQLRTQANVSRSIGHADERITKKHYAHLVKTTFPASMRRSLGVGPVSILPFPTKAAS
jgi:hypothetical protein